MTGKTTNNSSVKDVTSTDAKPEMSRTRRRALVASIAAAGAAGLPSQWKRPIVDHVLLPAHAQTSVSNIVTTSFTTTVVLPGVLATCTPIFVQSLTNTRISGTALIFDIFEATIGLCNDGSGGTATVEQFTSSFVSGGFPTTAIVSEGSSSFPQSGSFTTTITATATATSSATTTI